jgi:hypothetical protein
MSHYGRGFFEYIEQIEKRVREIEQALDPRTAQDEALDRWAAFAGTGRRFEETDAALRERIGSSPRPLTMPDMSAPSERIVEAIMSAGGLPRHLLAGTEPAGLNTGSGAPAVEAITRGSFVTGRRAGKTAMALESYRGALVHVRLTDGRWTPGWCPVVGVDHERGLLHVSIYGGTVGALKPEDVRIAEPDVFVFAPAAALAIGTRVRIDDKAHPCHDLEGTVIGHGPGGEIEVKLADDCVWAIAHRAQLALVDDTLRECETCGGSGQLPVFTSVGDCHVCGGAGVLI